MYRDKILQMIKACPIEVDLDVVMEGRAPQLATSEFLTNREQGDWAETIVHDAINQNSAGYFAIMYGRHDAIAAGEEGFADFYAEYQEELNTVGKKPDVLIYKRADFPTLEVDLDDDDQVTKAVAAIEVRSSAFLANKYAQYMESRQAQALKHCKELRSVILDGEEGKLLKIKNPEIYRLLATATEESFKELDFRRPGWSSTPPLRALDQHLRSLKDEMAILHKRDYLSITPKLEDIALVNRWIQRYNVRHFYLQVFFDKAYVIAFQDILQVACNGENEGRSFSIERDVKNQGKTTIKVNVLVGKEILGRIDMPVHQSVMKELERGRLLFFVRFSNGKGYLDSDVFMREIVNA